jgi:hypothetical protein
MNHLHADERKKRQKVNVRNRAKEFIEIVSSKKTLRQKLILILKSEKKFNEKGKEIGENLYLNS